MSPLAGLRDVALAFLVTLIFTLLFSREQDRSFIMHLQGDQAHNATLADSSQWQFSSRGSEAKTNATLGFEKVFVINTPSRFDRHKMYTLLGASYNLSFTMQEALQSDHINTHQQSCKDADRVQAKSNVASARSGAHSDAWRRMIEAGWSSMLVLEADTDFDVDIKFQMDQLSQAMLLLTEKDQDRRKERADANPYSLDWDILHLGHCGEKARDDEHFVAYDDPTAPTWQAKQTSSKGDEVAQAMEQWAKRLRWNMDNKSISKRVLQRSAGPSCTHSYAVTRRGAMRLLHSDTFDDQHTALDSRMRLLATDEQLVVYSVMATLFYRNLDLPLQSSRTKPQEPNLPRARSRSGHPSTHEQRSRIHLDMDRVRARSVPCQTSSGTRSPSNFIET